MNNKAQFTPLKKAVHAIPMLYAEAFAGSNNKEFVVELYEDARLLETAAPAMYAALREAEKHLTDLANYGSEGIPEPLLVSVRSAIAQAEGKQS